MHGRPDISVPECGSIGLCSSDRRWFVADSGTGRPRVAARGPCPNTRALGAVVPRETGPRAAANPSQVRRGRGAPRPCSPVPRLPLALASSRGIEGHVDVVGGARRSQPALGPRSRVRALRRRIALDASGPVPLCRWFTGWERPGWKRRCRGDRGPVPLARAAGWVIRIRISRARHRHRVGRQLLHRTWHGAWVSLAADAVGPA
jgi:hypothetical protein